MLGGPYTISATLSPAGVLGNYSITYNTAELHHHSKRASVTPDAASKMYGAADPALTGTLQRVPGSDGVTATYSRTAGETVAAAVHDQRDAEPAGVLSNYNITYNTADFTIDPSDTDNHGGLISWDAPAVDPFNKVYNGLVYTGFTVRYSGFVNMRDTKRVGRDLELQWLRGRRRSFPGPTRSRRAG